MRVRNVGGILHAGHDGLRDRRLYAEFLIQIAGVDTVQLGQAGHKSIKFKASLLAHFYSCFYLVLSGVTALAVGQHVLCAVAAGGVWARRLAKAFGVGKLRFQLTESAVAGFHLLFEIGNLLH